MLRQIAEADCTDGKKMYYYGDFDWPVLFEIPYKVARETDVQSLQFKIFNDQVRLRTEVLRTPSLT